jgi:hypothetical protein
MTDEKVGKSEYYEGLRARMPKGGWTCFHCDQTFTTPGAAEDHFGATPGRKPACLIKLGGELGLVMELRKAEALAEEYLNRALKAEDQEEALRGQLSDFERIAGGGVHELRCKIDSWQGEAITARALIEGFRKRDQELYERIIG